MQGVPASEAHAVGGVDDGIDMQTCDVALPEVKLSVSGGAFWVARRSNFFQAHHAFVLQLCLQFGILRLQKLAAKRLWLPHVHQRTQQSLPAFERGRYLGMRIVLPQQIADAVIQILQSVYRVLLLF